PCHLHSFPTRRSSDLWSLHIVVTSVDFFAHDRKVCLRCAQRIGLPGKPDRGHFDLGLQLTCGASTCEAEMPGRIVIFHGFSSGLDRKSTRLNSSHVSI